MTLIKFYDPVQTSFQNEDGLDSYEQLTRHFLPEQSDLNHRQTSIPANINEDKGAFYIEMALPGVNKKDIKIDYENGILTVNINHDAHVKNTEVNYALREFDYTNVSRTFRIGNRIALNKISASLNNGMLKLVLPKKEEFVHKPPRSISVE